MKFLVTTFRKLSSDPLYRNSIFLMASTGVMAFIGFFFWIIVSRQYSPEDVGLAGSLISISGLLISVATLGFPNTIIRFLPTSTKPQQKVSTGLALIAVMSMMVCLTFWFITKFVVTELHDLISTPGYFLLFTGAILIGAWDQLVDAVFIAYRQSHWVFLESVVFSVFKVFFAFILITFGALGVFASNFGALGVALMIDFFILFVVFHLSFSFQIDKAILKQVGRYAAGSFVVQLIGSLPPQVLPTLITGRLGAEQAAFFFLAQTIVMVLWIIPQASSQSVFAESANNVASFRRLAKRSLQIQTILAVLALVSIWFGIDLVLSVFGKSYAVGSTNIVKILSLSLIPVIVNNLLSVRLRILKKIRDLTKITVISTLVVMSACIVGANEGTVGVAWGYVVGQSITACCYFIHWLKFR